MGLKLGSTLTINVCGAIQDPVYPRGLETMARTSVPLTAQYLNVRQCKLGTIIIHSVHILQAPCP